MPDEAKELLELPPGLPEHGVIMLCEKLAGDEWPVYRNTKHGLFRWNLQNVYSARGDKLVSIKDQSSLNEISECAQSRVAIVALHSDERQEQLASVLTKQGLAVVAIQAESHLLARMDIYWLGEDGAVAKERRRVDLTPYPEAAEGREAHGEPADKVVDALKPVPSGRKKSAPALSAARDLGMLSAPEPAPAPGLSAAEELGMPSVPKAGHIQC